MNTRFPSLRTVACAPILALIAVPLAAQSADRLAGKNVSIAQTNYKGRSAIQVIAKPEAANATSYALVKDVSFRDGVIEVELAGQPAAGAGAGARGFIGENQRKIRFAADLDSGSHGRELETLGNENRARAGHIWSFTRKFAGSGRMANLGSSPLTMATSSQQW